MSSLGPLLRFHVEMGRLGFLSSKTDKVGPIHLIYSSPEACLWGLSEMRYLIMYTL